MYIPAEVIYVFHYVFNMNILKLLDVLLQRRE